MLHIISAEIWKTLGILGIFLCNFKNLSSKNLPKRHVQYLVKTGSKMFVQREFAESGIFELHDDEKKCSRTDMENIVAGQMLLPIHKLKL